MSCPFPHTVKNANAPDKGFFKILKWDLERPTTLLAAGETQFALTLTQLVQFPG